MADNEARNGTRRNRRIHREAEELSAGRTAAEFQEENIVAGTLLAGAYEIRNSALLREKAGRLNDPRHPFYVAMLSTDRYEAYLAEVGSKLVEVKGYKSNPISGRAEILYCRRNRWIVDKGARS